MALLPVSDLALHDQDPSPSARPAMPTFEEQLRQLEVERMAGAPARTLLLPDLVSAAPTPARSSQVRLPRRRPTQLRERSYIAGLALLAGVTVSAALFGVAPSGSDLGGLEGSQDAQALTRRPTSPEAARRTLIAASITPGVSFSRLTGGVDRPGTGLLLEDRTAPALPAGAARSITARPATAGPASVGAASVGPSTGRPGTSAATAFGGAVLPPAASTPRPGRGAVGGTPVDPPRGGSASPRPSGPVPTVVVPQPVRPVQPTFPTRPTSPVPVKPVPVKNPTKPAKQPAPVKHAKQPAPVKHTGPAKHAHAPVPATTSKSATKTRGSGRSNRK
jgi:hypothetical protein